MAVAERARPSRLRLTRFPLNPPWPSVPSLSLGTLPLAASAISSPTSQINWIRGRINTLEWDVGWDAYAAQLPPSFDIIVRPLAILS